MRARAAALVLLLASCHGPTFDVLALSPDGAAPAGPDGSSDSGATDLAGPDAEGPDGEPAGEAGHDAGREDAFDGGASDDARPDDVLADDALADDVLADDALADDALPDDALPDASDEPTDALLGVDTLEHDSGTPDGSQSVAEAGFADAGCGNGVLEPGEECDDGDLACGDGCDMSCRRELQIRALSRSGCTQPVVMSGTLAGGERGGLVASASDVLYAGDHATVLLDLPGLTNPRPRRGQDGGYTHLLSDLRTQKVYALGRRGRAGETVGARPFHMTELWELNGSTGEPLTKVALTATITFPGVSGEGIYSGWGFAIAHTGSRAFEIDLPSGRVADLGPMAPLNPRANCASLGAQWGVAERFGDVVYLVTVDSNAPPATLIKRFRVPDGQMSVVAGFRDLGYTCSFAVSPAARRWFIHLRGQTELGEGPSIIACDGHFEVTGDQRWTLSFPGVIKLPLGNEQGGYMLGQGAAYALANSFVVPPDLTIPEALGLWLEPQGTDGTTIALEVWGGAPGGGPDPTAVLASTGPFHPRTAGSTYVEMPLIAPVAPLTPGRQYWVVVTTIGLGGLAGRFAAERHVQNSDGLVDDGELWASYDPRGFTFAPTSPGIEIALAVRLRRAAVPGQSPDGGPADGGCGEDASVPASVAVLDVSPSRVDLGSQAVASVGSSVALTVTNRGIQPSGQIEIAIRGRDSGSFRLFGPDTCSGRSLAPNSSCTVGVQLAPLTDGVLDAELVASAAPAAHAGARLTAIGIAPARLEVEPASADFGVVPSGTPIERTVTVRNVGSARSGPIVRSLTGASAAEHTIVGGCQGVALDPGGTCTISVRSHAATAGAKIARLLVSASEGGVASVDLLTRVVAPARIMPVRARYGFGTLPPGQSPGRSTVLSFQNIGGVPTGPVVVAPLGGANPGDFAISNDACTGVVLPPAGRCSLTIAARPVSLGTKSARLGLSGSPGGTGETTIELTAASPNPVTAPFTWYDYGTIVVRQNSPNGGYYFGLKNPGPAAWRTSITTVGPNASEFIQMEQTCSGTLPAGRTCSMGWMFRPASAGRKHAQVRIEVLDPPASPILIDLFGTGVTSLPALRGPPAITFGYAFVGQSQLGRIRVLNAGTATTGPIATRIDGAPSLSVVADPCSGRALAPNAACSIDVRYTPARDGAETGRFTVTSTPGGTSQSPIQSQNVGRYRVSLQIGGVGSVSGPGFECSESCSLLVPVAPTVALAAAPDARSRFTGWGGSCSGNASCVLPAYQYEDIAVSAQFDPHAGALDVELDERGGGGGAVSATGIDCPDDCTEPAAVGSAVTLTARPLPGSSFEGWSGDCAGSALSCAVVVGQGGARVRASFAKPNIVFVSSATVTPLALGGLAGADRVCRAAAIREGLPGRYLAWVSSSTISALARLLRVDPPPVGWVRPDGAPFVMDLGALARGRILYPPNVTERGTVIGSSALVLTGSREDGQASAATCADWSSANALLFAGSPHGGTRAWSEVEARSCGAPHVYHLYCFGTEYRAPPAPPASSGRSAFLSAAPFDPSIGRFGADAICASEALAAGLAGRYRAWLATTDAYPLGVLNVAGRGWTRTDGVPVIDVALDLDRPAGLLNPLTVHADGRTYSGGVHAWTGTDGDPRDYGRLEATCADWNTGAPVDRGALGFPARASVWSASGLTSSCGEADRARVYCFEE